MQKVKLIALDMDETLIPSSTEEVSEENARAIAGAQKAGIPVTIATGRIYTYTKNTVDELNIRIPVIASNGADIRLNHKPIKTDTLDIKDVVSVINNASEFEGMMRFIFSGDYIYTTPNDKNEHLFERWLKNSPGGILPVKYFNSFDEIFPEVEGNVQKILLWAQNKDQHNEAKARLEQIKSNFNVSNGEDINLEINSKEMSKAQGLKYIADYLNIPMENVLAIGDSGNDAPMLEAAGISVAVENAMPVAKSAAKYITDSCLNDGVAKAIYEFTGLVK